jgi:hypothetical protein
MEGTTHQPGREHQMVKGFRDKQLIVTILRTVKEESEGFVTNTTRRFII